MTEKSPLSSSSSNIRLMKKKKNTCRTWRTESVKLTKHVPSFISFIRVNVFHSRAVPLITRCVLLQGRSEIFLPRRDLLNGFDQDEGNCGSLLGYGHQERRGHGPGVFQRLSTSSDEGRGHYRRPERSEDH